MGISKKLSKKQITALITILIMLLQMFSPYGILINTSQAVNPDTDKVVLMQASEYTGWSGKKGFTVEFVAIGDNVCSVDFNLTYDKDKIVLANKKTGLAYNNTKGTITTAATGAATVGGWMGDQALQNDKMAYDVNNSTIRISLSEPYGGTTILTDYGYEDDEGNPYLELVTLYFVCVNDYEGEFTKDMLKWTPSGSGMPTGFKYVYDNDGGTDAHQTLLDEKTFVQYEGFAEGGLQVESIAVTKQPTDLTYNNGDALDFTGGEITVTYDDTTTEVINIKDTIASGKLTVDSNFALDTKRKATFTYSGKTAEMPYYTLSNVTKKTDPSNTTYNHGDTIDFAGGELNLEYTDCNNVKVTEDLSIPLGITANTVTANRTTANVIDPKVTVTYKGYPVDIVLTVNDPIDHIAITKNPTVVEYNSGDPISFAGGEITVYKKSGTNSQIIMSTDPGITLGTTTADITSANGKWTVAGTGLEAGHQDITVNYAGFSAKYNITVNDTIQSIDVTKQPTAKNKYGTTSLDFSGMEVTVRTTGGGTFIADNNSVTVDTSSYDRNSLSEQEFTVNYAGKTSSTKAKITLEDYINDITINFGQTEFEHGTSINDLLSNATYTEIYAGGTAGQTLPVTSGMVNGYNGTPSAGLYNANHEYVENLTIKLTTKKNTFDEVPISKTQNITIKDKITGIEVERLPSQTGFDYGDTFTYTNGKIKTVYASGAIGDIIYMSDPKVKLTETDKTTVNMRPDGSQFSNGIATKTILVTYTKEAGKEYTTTYPITINNNVTGIEIGTEPTKTFNHGSTFGTGSGSLIIHWAVRR